jgi:hypothetical protein
VCIAGRNSGSWRLVANSEVTLFWSYFLVGGDPPGARKPKRLQRSVSASAIYHSPLEIKKQKSEVAKLILDTFGKSTTIWLWIDWVQHLRLCPIPPGER